MSQTVQLSPEILQLQQDIAALVETVGQVIAERDEMLNTVKPNLEAEYQKNIGYKLLERLEAEIAARRYKRHIELIRAVINRQESIEDAVIETQLDDEFQEWHKKLHAQYQKVKDAEARLNNLVSVAHSDAYKKLYRQLVFKLHPDLHPHQTEDEANLWYRVQQTYKSGELEALRSLMIILDAQNTPVELPSSKALLEERKTELTTQIQKIINTMSDLKKHFPFDIAAELADNDWVNAKVAEIQEQIDQWQDKCTRYKAFIEALLATKDTQVH